ncbi:MAG: hypothetical protein C5B50_00630 [Verrucomicrobia bacterium]|nr:MAG: hypothetical protein C5B50_00630 [Verrucomicrobiota bacterium]
MPSNIFQNGASSIPKSDPQIVRVNMEQIDIGGRKSHLPAQSRSEAMTIEHVPNASTMPGK